MSIRSHEFKRTQGIDGVRVTTCVPPTHPVYQGVMKAREVLGEFPRHVGRIKILPDIVPTNIQGHFVLGCCKFEDGSGRSVISVYAGSIEACTPVILCDLTARDVTLHEIGHSVYAESIQQGGWMGKNLELGNYECEKAAEEFVHNSISQWRSRQDIGPRRVMRELFQERSSQE